MTGFWWCMTPIVWAAGGWAIMDKEKEDYWPSAFASLVFNVPLWWSLYWAIRMVAE